MVLARVMAVKAWSRALVGRGKAGSRLAIQVKPVRSSCGTSQEACMKEVRKVHYVKGVFVCPKCRQSYVQEKWIESWRVRCHRCDYRGALTDVSVEERMEEETFRR